MLVPSYLSSLETQTNTKEQIFSPFVCPNSLGGDLDKPQLTAILLVSPSLLSIMIMVQMGTNCWFSVSCKLIFQNTCWGFPARPPLASTHSEAASQLPWTASEWVGLGTPKDLLGRKVNQYEPPNHKFEPISNHDMLTCRKPEIATGLKEQNPHYFDSWFITERPLCIFPSSQLHFWSIWNYGFFSLALVV